MIPISATAFDDRDFAAVVEPLRRGWVVQGECVRQFESLFATFTGLPHAVATSSGTTALHLALVAAGIRPGDEVLVPAFTWIATANSVVQAGARPVFVDIDLDTFCIDPSRIEAAISPRTRAIMPVHQFGFAADMDRILPIARAHGLRVIEDAACAFGTTIRGVHVGGMGDAGCFSFHPRKAITTGEGGMVTTHSDAIAQQCRSLRDHGAVRPSGPSSPFLLPDFPMAGFNYRLTDIQGALGCSQMAKAMTLLEGRRRVAARYDAALGDCEWLRVPAARQGVGHSYQSYVCLFAPDAPTDANRLELREQRNAIMTALEQRGIGTRQGTHSVPHTSYYASACARVADCCPQSLLAESLSIALPMHATLTDAEVDEVAGALQDAFATVGA